MRAICNVGASTKGTGGAGFIGQKGIGFKAVFRITDNPEIHSNGYHFALDVQHKVWFLPQRLATGFRPHQHLIRWSRLHHFLTPPTLILPLRIQVVPTLVAPPSRKLCPDPRETNILLPLNEEMKHKTEYLGKCVFFRRCK